VSTTDLSASSQNYLKAVWNLQEWSEVQVTPSMLAAKVGVRLSTASEAVRKLTEQGLLEHAPYGSVSLTAQGRAHAVAMVRRHRLVESFLVQALGYRWDEVHDEAESLEHAMSDLMVDRIDDYLGRPARDPHGDPIPRADGSVQIPNALPLSQLGAGERARIERISDDDPGMLRFFTDRGIGIGTVVEMRAAVPYSGSVEFLVAGNEEPVALGQEAVAAVWASRVRG
jgi:DtxR family Mn-dependent transcriptional regulator